MCGCEFVSSIFVRVLRRSSRSGISSDMVLVPLDAVWAAVMARSFTDSRRGEMNTKNGDEHGRKLKIQTHTTHTPIALVGPIHQLNRIHKGKAKGKVPWWMDCQARG